MPVRWAAWDIGCAGRSPHAAGPSRQERRRWSHASTRRSGHAWDPSAHGVWGISVVVRAAPVSGRAVVAVHDQHDGWGAGRVLRSSETGEACRRQFPKHHVKWCISLGSSACGRCGAAHAARIGIRPVGVRSDRPRVAGPPGPREPATAGSCGPALPSEGKKNPVFAVRRSNGALIVQCIRWVYVGLLASRVLCSARP